jgi:hypothetical protein
MSLRKSLIAAALGLTTALSISGTAGAAIDIGVSINIEPPELPVYEQPAIPAPGYLWTPGYWAWGGEDYYWVPGTWVLAPQPGYLWTPGYWGWGDGAYIWHGGYWGPHIGFYGGVNYGYGYTGNGFEGGEWRGGTFFYNRSAANIPGNVHITNVYNRTVINNVTVKRVSYNGGNGGIAAQPTPAQLAAEHERHLPPVAAQSHQQELARAEPQLHANANHGSPAIAATSRPGSFHGAGVVAAHGAAPLAPHAAAPAAHGPAATAQSHPPARSHASQAQPQAHSSRPEQPGGAGPAGAAREHEPAPQPHAQPEPQQHAEAHGGAAHEPAGHTPPEHEEHER